MRLSTLALALILIGTVIGKAQPPAVTAEKKLDTHLAGWENRAAKLSSFQMKFDLVKEDSVFKRKQNYTGTIACMKPNLAIFEISNNASKEDFERYLCNGKAIYQYDGSSKTVTEIKLPPGQGVGDNVILEFLSGMKAAETKKRFQITLDGEDKYYIYISIKPLLRKDQQEFQDIRLALIGPNVQNATPYLPAAMKLLKPNGDKESWTFSAQQIDSPNLKETDFQYREIRGWQFKQANPLTPPVMPGGTNLPPGAGAVKP